MATPSYYPPGWDKDRWQSATEEDFATLTDEQFATFHSGLRADLGEDGAETFFDEMDRKQAEVRKAAAAATTTASSSSQGPPNFLRVLDHLRDAAGEYVEWGFVVFRTAGYGDEDGLRGIKGRIEGLIDEQFDAAADNCAVAVAAEVQRARGKFRLMWFEEGDLNGATTREVARRFRELSVPIGLDHSLCLCVDGPSLGSIALERSGPAHVLAVSCTFGLEPSGDEADDERYTGSFKVAINTLVTELFAVIGDGSLTPYEVGVGVTEDLVWTNTSRAGRQRATVQ